MNRILRYASLALAILSLGALSASAQNKIAVVDLKKIFDGYYKTKQAVVILKERAADFEKTNKGMLEDYQRANEEYKKLLDSANDQAVSAEERDKRKKSAETKLLEIKEIENNVTAFGRQSRATLQEEQRRKRDNILRELREVISTKAKAGNFALVVDTAAESINNTPVILFTNGENDLTEEILRQVNANAPADVAKDKPADTKTDKPEKK